MYTLQKPNRKSSARTQIDIEGVKDGVLMLTGSRYRVVLKVSSLNFELKSEDEQDAIIETYESFLNSIGCPLQVLIRTREIDMDKYLLDLSIRYEHETEEIYQTQLKNYDEFIRSLIKTNKILTRYFYVVVPYEAGKDLDFDTAREQIMQRTDIVQKGLNRLGMSSAILSDLDTLDLFYSFYSPKQAKLQPLTKQALSLLHTGYVQTGKEL